MTSMTWIASTGGPLVILEDRLLDHWEGVGDAVQLGEGTDYDRACAVDGWIGIVEVGDGTAVVLGDEPAATCAFDAPSGVLVIRWIHASSDWDPGDVEKLLKQRWERSAIWTVGSQEQTVQDSAFAGGDSEIDRLHLRLPAGRYEVLTADHRPDPETYMVLHWIREVARGDAVRAGIS